MSIFLNKLPWSTILIFSQSVSSNAIFLNLLETWRQRPKSLNFKNLNKLSNVSSGKVSIGKDILVVKFDELEFMKKRFSFVLLTYFWLESLDKSRIKLTIVRGKTYQSFKLLRFPNSKFSIDSGLQIPSFEDCCYVLTSFCFSRNFSNVGNTLNHATSSMGWPVRNADLASLPVG